MCVAALTLLLVVLWSLTHRFLGFDGDGKLYAVQALAQIRPALANDVFLQNVSQDRFTIFSPLYSWCIELIGLPRAALALTLVFKVWFLTAAWWLVRSFSTRFIACLAVAALIVIAGRYGAFRVFQYSEDWLTARSLAEAMVITALALHFHGFRSMALAVVVGAFFVHPLMALPGILLLLCLWVPMKINVWTAAAGVLVSLATTLIASRVPAVARVLPVMDPAWLDMVRERSQFMFLQLWQLDDWELNARPFIALTLTALSMSDPRIGKWCLSAMLVGAAGLALALISNLPEPLAVFLQGQPWRWAWITTFSAVVLFIPTAAAVWRNDRCGPLCGLLLVGGWMFSAAGGAVFTGLAVTLWLLRNRIPLHISRYLHWAAILLGAIVAGWIIAKTMTATRPMATVPEPIAVAVARSVMGLDVVPLLIVGLLAHWIGTSKSKPAVTALCVLLIAASAVLLPPAMKSTAPIRPLAWAEEFSDWRRAIPPDSNVLVVPSPISASFAWFMLERPSYLSADQSSGVVFSHLTALEIRRRAAVVLPLWDTNWRLRSRKLAAAGGSTDKVASSRPLTKDALLAVCGDPALKFVVARENVGFDPLRHTHAGTWQDWNLYDCGKVNSGIVVPSRAILRNQ